ncbi:hypothetical protein Ddye_020976 [Dipteronia dyeriana]|uniref:Uncharacterized protein n=1 Tax=Dipteronia dyeriana TaxID=168575 RepID=A0AAD9WWH3_9ROSI|nr:hypothetical protein Ddye_020976 [Dipteronia dyeriana]
MEKRVDGVEIEMDMYTNFHHRFSSMSAGVDDSIGGTKNCGGAGGFTFGGPSHDPFPAAPSRWILRHKK